MHQPGEITMSETHSRRAVLAGIAAAPALAAPTLALTSGGPDPIFAAIKRHRAAAEAFTAMVDEQASWRSRTYQRMIRDGGILSAGLRLFTTNSRRRGGSSLKRRRASLAWSP
jgi:hypothetical protein